MEDTVRNTPSCFPILAACLRGRLLGAGVINATLIFGGDLFAAVTFDMKRQASLITATM
ncbi:hypothetical protein KCP69_03750 [Salmonella enterica subsp. enterica]|nr:hypothetical protein KCP69_03750 [Salmonella enterica subsp. enterica]